KDDPDSLHLSLGGLRVSPPKCRSRPRQMASPSHIAAACQESNRPAALHTEQCAAPARVRIPPFLPAPSKRPSISESRGDQRIRPIRRQRVEIRGEADLQSADRRPVLQSSASICCRC